MKYVYIGVGVLVVITVLVGFVFPMLISAKSSTAVVLGVSSMLIGAIALVHAGVYVYKKMKGNKNV